MIRRLGMCTRLLKEWSKKVMHNNRKAIDKLMKKIDEVQDNDMTVQDLGKIKEINNQLRMAWDREKMY